MKIGDKIKISKEYYLQKHREKFGNDIQINGLTNDNKIETCLIRAIQEQRELLIVDITLTHYDDEIIIYLHFIDDEKYECCLDYKFIKDDSMNIKH